MPILCKLLQKIEEKVKIPNSFYEASIMSKTRQGLHPQHTKLQIIPLKQNHNNPNKTLTNQFQQYRKWIIHHDQVEFILQCKTDLTSEKTNQYKSP